MALENYHIEQIDYLTAMDVIVKNHYLHRRCPCSIAFGLFFEKNLKGVVCYGTPSNCCLRVGVAGKEHATNVAELTRLWISDDVPKNGESFLIGNTVRKAGKEFIVSYAEPEQGHVGIVYQATNWLYTGLSAKRTNWHVEGLEAHSQTISDKYRTVKQLKETFGDKFKLVPRPRKHRYIFINANRARKKQLLAALKYPVLAYPKKKLKNPLTSQAAWS